MFVFALNNINFNTFKINNIYILRSKSINNISYFSFSGWTSLNPRQWAMPPQGANTQSPGNHYSIIKL